MLFWADFVSNSAHLNEDIGWYLGVCLPLGVACSPATPLPGREVPVVGMPCAAKARSSKSLGREVGFSERIVLSDPRMLPAQNYHNYQSHGQILRIYATQLIRFEMLEKSWRPNEHYLRCLK